MPSCADAHTRRAAARPAPGARSPRPRLSPSGHCRWATAATAVRAAAACRHKAPITSSDAPYIGASLAWSPCTPLSAARLAAAPASAAATADPALDTAATALGVAPAACDVNAVASRDISALVSDALAASTAAANPDGAAALGLVAAASRSAAAWSSRRWAAA